MKLRNLIITSISCAVLVACNKPAPAPEQHGINTRLHVSTREHVRHFSDGSYGYQADDGFWYYWMMTNMNNSSSSSSGNYYRSTPSSSPSTGSGPVILPTGTWSKGPTPSAKQVEEAEEETANEVEPVPDTEAAPEGTVATSDGVGETDRSPPSENTGNEPASTESSAPSADSSSSSSDTGGGGPE